MRIEIEPASPEDAPNRYSAWRGTQSRDASPEELARGWAHHERTMRQASSRVSMSSIAKATGS